MKTLNKFFLFFALTSALFITGCVDNDFDVPENTFTVSDTDVISVRDIIFMLNPNADVLLDSAILGGENKYIKATINADDASGNFYKTVSFQDNTAALSIIADRNELNAEFPAGNVVYVRLNGLTITLDANLPRLGYGVENGRLQRIPDLLVNDFLIPGGKAENELTPIVATIEEFRENPIPLFNALVRFDNVEFSLADVGSTFASPDDPDGPQSKNTMIQDCNDNELIVRNSGFADFASDIIPAENGSIQGIISVFNDDLQFFIRDLSDLNLTEDRCDGSGGQAGNEITIQSLQDRYYDLGADSAPEGYIKGIVISDKNTGQINNQNIFIQNGEDGILVRFSSQHSFNLGDELQITVTDRELSEFNELLQVNEVPLFNAEFLGTKPLPNPKELTVSEILANNNTYESTRVLIKGATLSSGGTFAGDVDVDDGTGTIRIFTFNETSYADDPVPSGVVDVTAIVGDYNGPQLIINGSGDVTGGTIDPNPGTGNVNQDFEGFNDFDPVNFEGWINTATKGTRVWYTRSFDNNGFAECEAFQDDNPETEAWLITPTIDTEDLSIFSFQTAQAFWKHQGLSVWISQDFSSLQDASWVELDGARIANQSDEDYEMIASGDIDLTDYVGGKVRVGFLYQGTAASNTTKMRIDNVKLK